MPSLPTAGVTYGTEPNLLWQIQHTLPPDNWFDLPPAVERAISHFPVHRVAGSLGSPSGPRPTATALGVVMQFRLTGVSRRIIPDRLAPLRFGSLLLVRPGSSGPLPDPAFTHALMMALLGRADPSPTLDSRGPDWIQCIAAAGAGLPPLLLASSFSAHGRPRPVPPLRHWLSP